MRRAAAPKPARCPRHLRVDGRWAIKADGWHLLSPNVSHCFAPGPFCSYALTGDQLVTYGAL